MQKRRSNSYKQLTEYVYDVTDFIMEITVTAGQTVTIPFAIDGTYDCTVWFGDGSFTTNVLTYNDPDLTHTYINAGTYTVVIVGTATRFFVNGGAFKNVLTKITQWGKPFIQLQFLGCNLLTLSTVTDVLDTTNMTSFNAMFSGCSAITTINRIDEWVTTNVTNMGSMFTNCTNFNDDVTGWDTQNVTTMQAMFQNCSNFNQNISVWDVSSVQFFGIMFSATNSFNQPIGSWVTNSAKDMGNMFANNTIFNQDISSWNTSNVLSMRLMFQLCPFNQDISGWDVNKVSNFEAMFRGASNFSQDLSSWDISSATNMIQWGTNANFTDVQWDAKLNAWSALTTPPSNITIGVNATHTAASQAAFDNLINNYGWTIKENNII